MPIHLMSMLGPPVTTLQPMLDHYLRIGADSAFLYVHEDRADGPLLRRVRECSAAFPKVEIQRVTGPWLATQTRVFSSIAAYPGDWFLLADQDEFQLYSPGLHQVLQECDRRGYDHVNGALIDRVAGNGTLAPLQSDSDVWRQYPVGAYLTEPICGAPVRKVVAAKGCVKLTPGHHFAIGGRPAPISELFVQVHHFKWIDGAVDYLKGRVKADDIAADQSVGSRVDLESHRFVQYLESEHGRINLEEPALMAARCDPYYPHWETVTRICLLKDFSIQMRIRERLRQRDTTAKETPEHANYP